LMVLMIWDSAHKTVLDDFEPAATLSGFILPTSTIVPVPEPTAALQSYQISTGETLSDVALLFDVSVAELLEINGLTDPDSIGSGTVIFVPVDAAEEVGSNSVSEGPVNSQGVSSPGGQVEIMAVVGPGDLGSERVQLRGTGEGSLDLAGWRLRDEDNNEYNFPKITLFPNGAVNIYTAAGVDTVVALYWGASKAVWSSGEAVTLLDANGNIQATYQVP